MVRMTWRQCEYGKTWGKLLTQEARSHPAKYPRGPLERIAHHGLEQGWWNAGDLVVDPMAGVGCGGLIFAALRVRWWGLEIDKRFVKAGSKVFDNLRSTSYFYCLPMPEIVRDRLKSAGIAPMQGIEDCLFAIHAAAGIGAVQRNVVNILPVAEPARAPGDSTMLDEWDSKQALAGAGVSVPSGKVCNQDETVTCANSLGYPVVLKALSAQLAHKSEAGAVAVGLNDAVAVQKATDRMAADFDRFLVEQMVEPAVAELIVGINRDDTFGLTLLVGTGGTMVELLDDTVSLLLPVQREEIKAAVASLRAGALIHGYRGGPAGDLDAVLDAIEAIARYAETNSDALIELDVNPLIVTPHAAVAADALIRIGTHDPKE